MSLFFHLNLFSSISIFTSVKKNRIIFTRDEFETKHPYKKLSKRKENRNQAQNEKAALRTIVCKPLKNNHFA
jgi:hypothetical protein